MNQSTKLTFLLLFVAHCSAIVFDATTAKKSQEIFKNRLQTLKTQATKQGRDAVKTMLETLETEGLEALEHNKRVVNLARILLINYVLKRNAALLQQQFNMTKREITAWVDAKMSNYTIPELWAANLLLQARMKDFLANLSSSLRWGQIV